MNRMYRYLAASGFLRLAFNRSCPAGSIRLLDCTLTSSALNSKTYFGSNPRSCFFSLSFTFTLSSAASSENRNKAGKLKNIDAIPVNI